MRNWIIICVILFGYYSSSAQVNTYSFSNIEQAMKEEQRPILVFFYTDWCNYCELMKKKTFKNEAIVEKLNKDFYLIFFNGESKDDVYFHDHKFSYKKRGIKSGTHEIAETLASINGNIGYPTVVVLNTEYEIVFQQNSYLKPSKFLNLLNVVN